MTPEAEIAKLNRQLEQHGEEIELQRLTGNQLIPIKVRCRAFVRPAQRTPEELIAGIVHSSSIVVISPTEINAAGWPGPEAPVGSTTDDIRVPRKNDKAVIAGRSRNVEWGVGFRFPGGVLVRIEMRVSG